MSVKFMTNPEAMKAAAGKLKSFAEEYGTVNQQLKAVATGMGAAYQTPDNLAFVSKIEEFCAELTRMAERLNVSGDVLNEQAKAYRDQEQANTGLANKLPC